MGQKAEWSCCGFDKSQPKQFVGSAMEFSVEMLLRGSVLSASDKFGRCSSSPLESSNFNECVPVYICVTKVTDF